MEFIMCLLAAVLAARPELLQRVHRDDWFQSWHDTLRELPVPSGLVSTLTILGPVVLLVWLLHGLSDWFFGLFGLVLTALVLAYALGRWDFRELLSRYRSSLSHDDPQAALLSASEAVGEADDLVSLQYEFEYELIYNEFERWFAVLFWFLLAGPAAALAYRLLVFLSRDDEPLAHKALGVVEWLPARLTGLSMALVGNFDDFLARWEDTLDHGLDTRASLQAFLGSPLDPDLNPAQALERVDQISKQYRRAMILWVVMSAVYVLFS